MKGWWKWKKATKSPLIWGHLVGIWE